MLYFKCLFWLPNTGWNPALVLSPTLLILAPLGTTCLEPHVNSKHFKTILTLSLNYPYTVTSFTKDWSKDWLLQIPLKCKFEREATLFFFSLITNRKPFQTACWKLKQLRGLLLPHLMVSSFMVASYPVLDKLRFLTFFCHSAVLSHRYSNSR